MQGFLKTTHPSVYERTAYTSLEASPDLAARQHSYVSEACEHGDRYTVRVGDATDSATWPAKSLVRTLVLHTSALRAADKCAARRYCARANEQYHETKHSET